jgi:uncharacterized protein (PEP-CTERM system associated)
MRLTMTSSTPRRRPLRLSAVALAALALASMARAQVPVEVPASAEGQESITPQGPPPRVWIEPRVFARQWYSDNYLLTPTDRQAEWTTELGASVMAVFNLPRLTGSVDYSLSALYQARGVGDEDHLQGLTADLLLDAWNNTAFVEFNGNIGRNRVSAFDVQPAGDFERPNLSETKQFRVSPYLRGSFNDAVDYELRYSRFTSRTEADTRSDIDENSVLARVGSSEGLSRLGWSLEASRSDFDYSLGREVKLQQVIGQLNYALTPTLLIFAQGGRESNDVLTTDMESYATWGGGFDWRPTQNARIALGANKRFFGHDHNLQLEYQMRRSVVRFTDSRDISTSQFGLGDENTTLSGLLDALYGGSIPDPVQRAQRVQSELDRLGLPGDLTDFPGYLTSFVTEQRTQELSFVMLLSRGAITAAINRTRSNQLNSGLAANDDFSLAGEILEKGWTVGYAHRLTPRTAASIIYQRQENEGVGTDLRNRLDSVTLGLTSRLSARTTGVLLLRRSSFDAITPYRETAIQAMVSHRF